MKQFRLLVSGALLLAAFCHSGRAEGCDSVFVQDLTIYQGSQTLTSSVLDVVDETWYSRMSSQQKAGLQAMIYGKPLGVSWGYDKFKEEKKQYHATHSFQSNSEASSAFVARTMPKEAYKAFIQCKELEADDRNSQGVRLICRDAESDVVQIIFIATAPAFKGVSQDVAVTNTLLTGGECLEPGVPHGQALPPGFAFLSRKPEIFTFRREKGAALVVSGNTAVGPIKLSLPAMGENAAPETAVEDVPVATEVAFTLPEYTYGINGTVKVGQPPPAGGASRCHFKASIKPYATLAANGDIEVGVSYTASAIEEVNGAATGMLNSGTGETSVKVKLATLTKPTATGVSIGSDVEDKPRAMLTWHNLPFVTGGPHDFTTTTNFVTKVTFDPVTREGKFELNPKIQVRISSKKVVPKSSE